MQLHLAVMGVYVLMCSDVEKTTSETETYKQKNGKVCAYVCNECVSRNLRLCVVFPLKFKTRPSSTASTGNLSAE